MMVKICGITNREDALAAIDGGAAALGFNFYAGSPRYIAPEAAAVIAAGLPARVWKVGVFVDEAAANVERIARQVGLDVAQLHGSETPKQYPRGTRVWKAIRVLDSAGETACPTGVEAVLLDGPASGQAFDWARVPHGVAKLILAGGLDAGNVREAIAQVRPWGVDACSRLESSPGRKDHFKMAAFLKAALEVAS
ncbi:MAG: phosphoribosylanthranilate isomerase [Bryobacteraceae bacterium]|jgi:phosphoribosylanthranilate isomerase